MLVVAAMAAALIGSAALGVPGGDAANDAANRVAVRSASSGERLVRACRHLAAALGERTAVDAAPTRSARQDADLDAVRALLASRRPRAVRARCARDLVTYTGLTYADPRFVYHSAYADDVVRAVAVLLHDRDPQVRVAGAQALWGEPRPLAARALLAAAGSDRDPRVVGAAFTSLFWPMRADVAVTHDPGPYRRAIENGLRSSNAAVVAGAAIALTGLDGPRADRTLFRLARDADARRRVAAIEAFGYLGEWKPSYTAFFIARLADRDATVRDAVMLLLAARPDPRGHAALDSFAHSGPTARDRAHAAEYLEAFSPRRRR